MDIDQADAILLEAVSRAYAEYFRVLEETVFADPSNPDFLVWPTDLWPSLVQEYVVPAAQDVFRQVLASYGISDPELVDSATATFVGQDLAPVTQAETVPSQTQGVLLGAVAAGASTAVLAALLSPDTDVWQPMLNVMASNGAASAVNAATFVAAMSASDGGIRRVTKTWIARDDQRTRPTHAAVDNNIVLVNDVFNVGGFPLRYPHDPFGPVHEVVNCRCVLRFGVTNG